MERLCWFNRITSVLRQDQLQSVLLATQGSLPNHSEHLPAQHTHAGFLWELTQKDEWVLEWQRIRGENKQSETYEVKRQRRRATMEERERDEMLHGYQWLTVPPYRTLYWTSKKMLLIVSRPWLQPCSKCVFIFSTHIPPLTISGNRGKHEATMRANRAWPKSGLVKMKRKELMALQLFVTASVHASCILPVCGNEAEVDDTPEQNANGSGRSQLKC